MESFKQQFKRFFSRDGEIEVGQLHPANSLHFSQKKSVFLKLFKKLIFIGDLVLVSQRTMLEIYEHEEPFKDLSIHFFHVYLPNIFTLCGGLLKGSSLLQSGSSKVFLRESCF